MDQLTQDAAVAIYGVLHKREGAQADAERLLQRLTVAGYKPDTEYFLVPRLCPTDRDR